MVLLAITILGSLPASRVLASSMYQYYNTGDTNKLGNIHGDLGSMAETFTIEVSHTVTIVKVKLYRLSGDPGTVTVSVHATSDELPSGSALCSGNMVGANLTTDTEGAWYPFSLGAGAVLSDGVLYAIVITSENNGFNEDVRWRADLSDATYAGGEPYTRQGEGEWSSAGSTYDFMFEEWGEVAVTLPEASTQAASGVGYNEGSDWFEATLNGTVVDDGGEACYCAFQYRVVGGDWKWANCSGTYVSDETYNATLINLLSETDYEFFGYATNSEGDSLNALSNREFELGTPPTGWSLTGSGASFVRSSEQKKLGVYSGKVTRGGTDCYIAQGVSGYGDCQGDRVFFGMWVYATVAERARLAIYDGVAYGYSDYHSGSSTFEFLDISFDVDGSATELSVRGEVKTGDTSAYFDTSHMVQILEFETEWVISVPTIVTYGYPLIKYDYSARIYGEVGYDGGSPVEVWFQYRVKDTPPWVDVAVTNMVVNGGMEEGNPPDNWSVVGSGATLVRSDVQIKEGSYSGLLTRVGNDCYMKQEIGDYGRWADEDVTLGKWVYASVAGRARLQVYDGVGNAYSSYHTGGSTWEWLNVTLGVDSTPTVLEVRGVVDTGDTGAYFDEAVMVRFDSCGSDGEWGERLETGGGANTLLTGLDQLVTYEFRLVGENETGEANGGIANFKLWGDVVVPEVRTDGTKFIEDTNAWVEGYLVDDGGMPCFVGFEYKEVGSSRWLRTPIAGQKETDGDWSCHLENLSPDTNYDYRAWAWNEVGESYGEVKVLYLHETFRTPVVRTRDGEWVDSTTLRLCSTLDYDGGYESDIWFEYRLLGGSTWAETVETLAVTTGYDVERLVFNLETGFWYEFRVVGRNVMGLGYGEILNFEMTATEEEGGGVPSKPPVEWIEDMLKGWGMSNEFGHWMIMLVLMVTAFIALHKSEVLRVMIPVLIFGLAMIIGWVEWWFIILLALGAGVTMYSMLRRKMAGGGE